MSRERVSLVLYHELNPARGIGGWGALLSLRQHERVECGVVASADLLTVEIEALTQSLRCLKRPCTVDCYQRSGPLKRWLASQGVPAGSPLEAAMQGHNLQWHWWLNTPSSPQHQRLVEAVHKALEAS